MAFRSMLQSFRVPPEWASPMAAIALAQEAAAAPNSPLSPQLASLAIHSLNY